MISRIYLIILLATFTAVHSQTGNEHTLTIRVSGIALKPGTLRISIFNNDAGFPGDFRKAFTFQSVKPDSDHMMITFEKLPAGSYAVSILHDENDNTRMDTNWLGIPKEGSAVSNNAQPAMRAPRFDEAVFELKSDTLLPEIVLKYY